VAWASTPVGAPSAPQTEVVESWLVIAQPFVLLTVQVKTTLGTEGVNVIDAIFEAEVIVPPVICHA